MNVTALKHAALAAMPLSLAKQYTRLFNPIRYKKEFDKWGSGNGPRPYRIYIPVGKKPLQDRHVVPDFNVSSWLGDNGYIIDNYLLGTATNVKTKKTAMIADLLKNESALLQMFENNPARASAKLLAGKSLLVISRHPYDIAGTAFGRKWTSSSDHQSEIARDIRDGSLVAYHVKADDRNINRPASHIMLGAYQPVGATGSNAPALMPEDDQYTPTPAALFATAQAFANKINKSRPDGLYVRTYAPHAYKILFLKNGKPARQAATDAYNGGELTPAVSQLLSEYPKIEQLLLRSIE